MCQFRNNQSSLNVMSAALRGNGGQQDFDPRALFSADLLDAHPLPAVEGVADLAELFRSLRTQQTNQT